MNNNVVFNKMLHLTGLGRFDDEVIKIFKDGGFDTTKNVVKGWRRNIDHPRRLSMPDEALIIFLDALFELRDSMGESGVNLLYTQNMSLELP